MKVLIGYASKTGTTKKCAMMLCEQLPANCKVVDLSSETPALDDYDFIIIGGSVRMGKLHKKAKNYILKNKDKLLDKKFALFICNGFTDPEKQMITNVFEPQLINNAIIVDTFGGELNLDTMKGMDKLISKKVLEQMKPEDAPHILEDNIANFIKIISNEFINISNYQA